MQNELVSVIVVSYNHSQYIAECLDSLKRQSYTNWELIVADDASSDTSLESFEGWLADKNVNAQKVYNTTNKGLCATLNACLKLCKGAYIKAIAADDFLHEDFLLKSVELLQTDYQIGAVFSDAYFVDEKSRKTGKTFISHKAAVPSGWIFEKLIFGNFIPAPSLLIKAEMYKKLGDYDENTWIEDWEFALRIAQFYKIAYTGKPLVYYRRHSHNISFNNSMVLEEWKLLNKYDQDGKNSAALNNFAKHKFFDFEEKEKIIKIYRKYKYHNSLLLFFLKNNLNGLVYRIISRILSFFKLEKLFFKT